jgi:hypothetical protein
MMNKQFFWHLGLAILFALAHVACLIQVMNNSILWFRYFMALLAAYTLWRAYWYGIRAWHSR